MWMLMLTENSKNGLTVNGLLDRLCDSLIGRWQAAVTYEAYQEDPVGFGEEVLRRNTPTRSRS